MPPRQSTYEAVAAKATSPRDPSPGSPPGDGSAPTPRKRSRSTRAQQRESGDGKTTKSAKRSRPARPSQRDSAKGAPTTSAKRPVSTSTEAVAVVDSERRRVVLQPRALMTFALAAFVIVLGASVAAFFVASLGSTVRAARAEVLYELDAERPTGFLRQDRQLTTQLVTIRSRAVLEPAAEASGLTFDELSNKVEVTIVDDSEVLRIEIHDGSASRAKALVAAVTREYLAHVQPSGATEARQYLENELGGIDERRRELTSEIAELPTAEQALVIAEIQNLLVQRSTLQSRLEDLTVDEFRDPQVEEITPAYVLADPVSPRPRRAAAAGALAGLLVAGVAIAVLVRRRWSAALGA